MIKIIKILLNWTIIPILKLIFIVPAAIIFLYTTFAGREDIGDRVLGFCNRI